jgi:hypothetical protein
MDILESYLRAVKRCLPRAQSEDIIKELSDELHSQIDEQQAALGRPFNDAEMMAFFKQHGDPMTVARRYRQDHHSLSLGWELIGPELFPTYLMFLAFNLTLTIASGKAAVAFVNLIYVPMMHISGLFYPLPKFLRAISPLWPSYHLQQLVFNALGAPFYGRAGVHIAVLLGVTLLLTLLSMRRLARVG